MAAAKQVKYGLCEFWVDDVAVLPVSVRGWKAARLLAARRAREGYRVGVYLHCRKTGMLSSPRNDPPRLLLLSCNKRKGCVAPATYAVGGTGPRRNVVLAGLGGKRKRGGR